MISNFQPKLALKYLLWRMERKILLVKEISVAKRFKDLYSNVIFLKPATHLATHNKNFSALRNLVKNGRKHATNDKGGKAK